MQPLRISAEGVDGVHAQRGLHGDKTSQRRIAALELLADQSITDGIETRAVIAVNGGAEHAQVGEPRDEFAGEAMLLKAIADQRFDFAGDETRNAVLHHAFFVAQARTHGEQIQRVQ